MQPIDIAALRQSADPLQRAWGDRAPRSAAILGSGWGAAIDADTVLESIPYTDIAVLGAATVDGHAGTLHLARTGAHHCLIFEGRRHRYECTGWEPVVFPAYLAHVMGAHTILMTNAAGGIRNDLRPGDLMVIDDHINAMGGTPLQGPHREELGPRFPDMTRLYTHALRAQLKAIAAAQAIDLKHGIYLAVDGPAYETPAEVRAYAAMGADAVGMSTVPEAIVAGALGLNVAGLACITNPAAATGNAQLAHAEVLTISRTAAPGMQSLVRTFLESVGARPAAKQD